MCKELNEFKGVVASLNKKDSVGALFEKPKFEVKKKVDINQWRTCLNI